MLFVKFYSEIGTLPQPHKKKNLKKNRFLLVHSEAEGWVNTFPIWKMWQPSHFDLMFSKTNSTVPDIKKIRQESLLHFFLGQSDP